MNEPNPAKQSVVRASFYDLARLFSFRDALESLREEPSPKAVSLEPPGLSGGRRVGILPGSFNPPTLAHIELARRAREIFGLDAIVFTLSRVTVDKEKVEGLILEDRLLLLSLIAGDLGWARVSVVNRGLYYEQARAFRSLLGNSARISFIVGLDKLIQIFDARYYQDREAALRVLLTEAQLLVAMRGALGMDDVEQLLSRRENEPYRDRVFPFTLPVGMKEISSSSVRSRVAAAGGFQEDLPEVAAAFIVETGACLPRYQLRARLFDRLYGMRDEAAQFFDLVKQAEKNYDNGLR
jgi:nicotinic acid mononucleotide adenylyltransferase